MQFLRISYEEWCVTERVTFYWRVPMIYTCGERDGRCAVANKRLRLEKITADPAKSGCLLKEILCRRCGECYGWKRLSNEEAERVFA